ncbi:MAG TPA: hypothetical protein VNM37_02330 [Candidatus Dormibacteraeota bacterium]|nr:hypothetical protein [Candidatus Dormibacteraeota bacterium]
MTIEAAIAEVLAGDQGVQALASGRVYQLKFPQVPEYPAGRVQLIDEPLAYDLSGPTGLIQSLVQVDAAAYEADGDDPYAAATALGKAIDEALSGQAHTVSAGSPAVSPPEDGIFISAAFRESRRVDYDPDELRIVVCQQDYRVWWRFN